MAIYCYKRCSTNETKQSVARQLLGMTFDKEFIEYASGSSEEGRPVFNEMKDTVKSGDEIWFGDLSRAGRNTSQLLASVEELMLKGVKVVFKSENLTFVSGDVDPMQGAISKMLLTMLASVNELFLTKNKIEIKQGLENAKSKGIKLGGANPKHRETFAKNREAGLHKSNPMYQTARDKQTPLLSRIRTMIKDSNGRLTQGEMVDKLKEEGWVTVRGKQITQGGLSALIKKYDLK